MALIYRRLVLLSGAHAEITHLARTWGVIVTGWIGRNARRELECYNTLTEARFRRRQVNRRGTALIMSIDEILYPLSFVFAKYDSNITSSLPPTVTRSPTRKPYTRVEDVYELLPRRAKISQD